MTENNDKLIDEQITKEPEKVQKQKDPKKVAAGKKLAEYHKKAKKALELENNTDDDNENSSSKNWMPEISLTTGLSLVGITLTAVDLYFRWKKNNKNITPIKPDNHEENEDKPVSKTPVKSKIPVKSKTPVPIIGME